jgi:adenosine kinase
MTQYFIFCMGNALLDMLVTSGEELLQTYGLKENDAILAEEKHCTM